MVRHRVGPDWQEYRRQAPWLAVIGALAVGLVWLVWSSTRLNDARASGVCAVRYRAAQSAADTARVDALWPGGGSTRVRNGAATVRCGTLRAAGRLPV